MIGRNPVPTEEELKEQAEKDQAELEVLKEKDEEAEEEEKEEEEPEDEKEEEVKPEVDHKKKFIESQREAKVLHSKVKGFEKASEVPDPTDKDMEVEYSDWEDLSDFEKKIAKNDWKNTRRNEAIDQAISESKNVDEWNSKVDKTLDDPQILIDTPALEGKLEDLKIFVSKPSRRGVDFDDLIKAFLFDVQENKPAKKKGQMFEKGSGGPSKKSKPKGKLTIEEGAKLRKRDGAEFKRQLLAGNIEEF